MLLGVTIAFGILALAGFALALRAARRAPGGLGAGRSPAGSTRGVTAGGGVALQGGRGAVGALDRLAVGARVDADSRTWRVLGTVRATGEGWAAWHVEELGQRGLLLIDDADPSWVVIAVGAEHVEELDPRDRPLRWRRLDWRSLGETAGAFGGEGHRQRWRREEDLPTAGTITRIDFANPGLERRRLIFLRTSEGRGSDDDGPWDVWIGDLLPASGLDVFAPLDLTRGG